MIVIRLLGIILAFTTIVLIPSLCVTIVTTWFMKNVVIMAALLGTTIVVGTYAVYLILRYMVLQYTGKLLGKRAGQPTQGCATPLRRRRRSRV